ncbi:ubiquitin-protein ligase [Lithospermum erythrorhizon]|uniref:Ubiquitin-protein ligase n=1 Tax=Lithospermum erythrorhizon TaxID=34254 RepID=A0AAV3PS53_LITER
MEESIFQENDQNNKLGEIEEIIDDVEKRFKEFKKFYILSNTPRDDHRFHLKIFSSYHASSLCRSSEKYHELCRKIRKELALLEENLPDSIFVRAYYRDIDFLRAVIINPPDAPFYPNGLFFFDILFPSNYPSDPPKIQYRDDDSLKMISNNNLDVIGKWNKDSSILDVLLETKERIFNAKPYSNDGLLSHIFPESKSKLEVVKHTKKAMFLNHKGMMYSLRYPPSDFEDYVKGYYRTRAHVILLSYKNLLDEVGADNELVLLFKELIKVFERNGTYCEHHLVHVHEFKKELTFFLFSLLF